MEEKLARSLLHDISNALFILSGKAELLLGTDISTEAKESLKEISAQADRIKMKVQELSDLIKGIGPRGPV